MTDVPSAVVVSFRGQVQGVGFRALVKSVADRVGVGGDVKNLRDGSVQATFVATPARIQCVLEEIQRERSDQIQSVRSSPIALREASTNKFEIIW